jgi:hypothetical protein
MLGSTFIETAIGLSLIFLLMSLMCSVVCETIARWLKWREGLLYSSIAELVRGATFRDKIYKHELIQGLGTPSVLDLYAEKGPFYLPKTWFDELKKGAKPAYMPDGLFRWLALGQRPSYIPSDIFARVLVDLVVSDKGAAGLESMSGLRTAVENLTEDKLKIALRALLQDPEIVEVEQAHGVIARWFDSAMMPVTERFKRLSQRVVFLLAIPLTLVLNVDTLLVANRLQRDKSLREAVVASAISFAHEREEPEATGLTAPPAYAGRSRLLALHVELEQLKLPLGWPTEAEVKAAHDKVTDADQVLTDTRADAAVLAGAWKAAREDVKSKHTAFVEALAKGADATAKKDEYGEAKTAALAARGEDERARAAVELALVSREHWSLNEAEMRSRTLESVWPLPRAFTRAILLRLAGWLFTVLAVSLGTRFWFDTLGKLVSIRSGVKPKEEDKKDS